MNEALASGASPQVTQTAQAPQATQTSQPPFRALRKTGVIIRETLLTIAALGGVVCIVLVVLAFTGGFSLIMFKTGSMSPTIPAGSVALVREVPASDVKVGDVLTVDRPGQLPVTHRVTSVAEGATETERTITMQGDANDVEDPAPYVIEQGRLVIGSVPHLANVIVWFGNPLVLGGITVGAALLVTWAFWPRDPQRPDAPPPNSDGEDPGTARPARHAAVMVVAATVLTGAMSAIGTFGALGATPAQAQGPVVLRSDLAPGVHALDATVPLNWHIDIDASAAPNPGELSIATATTGNLELGMSIEVRSCDAPWAGAICSSGEQVLRPSALAALDGAWEPLFHSTTPTETFVRVALTAVPLASATGSETAEMTVRASAGGWAEEVTVGGQGELAKTGSGAGSIGLILAPIAVVSGLLIAWVFRRRAASSASEVAS